MFKNHRRWALAAVPVLGLIFFSAQQTGALWSDSKSFAGGTITSGTLDIGVGAGGASQSSYAFSALGKAGLMPGGFAQAPLTVRNSGNVTMKYRLQNVAQSNAAVPLTLTVSKVAAEGDCPAAAAPAGATQLYNGPMIGAQTPTLPAWRTLGAGAAEVLCLRGTVGAAETPGASTTATFTFASES